ncbi:unnamed protein product [Ectocarpus sp. 12 AP-2014]
MMNGQTKSYLSAVILLLAAAIQQADAFMVAPAGAGKVSAGNKVEARGNVFKLNLSPYEEYMASRGGGNSAPAPAPAAPSSPASSPVSSPASSGGGAKWQPKADWKSAKTSSKPSYAPAAASPRPPTARAAAPAYAPPAVAAPAYTPPAPYSPPAAAAPAPAAKTGEKHIGTGGMADTRDPAPVNHEDPRKSISAAPSFAEYLKSKQN